MTDRRTLSRLSVLAAVACLIALPGCDPPPPEGKQVGNLAPEIVGEDVDGKPLRLSDHRGKVVLLNFWGTWCAPCRAMIPHEREMVEHKYKDRPVVIFGIANDSAGTLKEFMKNTPLPWPNIVDANKIVARTWGVNAYPTYVLVDHKGVIRERWQGAGEMNDIWTAVGKAVTAAEAQ